MMFAEYQYMLMGSKDEEGERWEKTTHGGDSLDSSADSRTRAAMGDEAGL
jgi:hypothetical protein